jgi:superfamily II DNA helicase RecQ
VEFRPEYVKVLDIRGIFTNAPILGLSATVTARVLMDLMSKFNAEEGEVVVKSLPPDRPNIFLEIRHQASYDLKKDLAFVIDSLRREQRNQPKTIIFASTHHDVNDIFELVMWELRSSAYEGGKRDPECRYIAV